MNEPNKDLLSIDLGKLEEDCREQPKSMYEWGLELSKAKRVVKSAKNRTKLQAAALDKQARENPMRTMGVEKTTEKAIEAFIVGDEEYRQCQQDLIDAEYAEDVLAAFVEAWRDRREQLGNEVKLFGQMYWSKPDTSGPTQDQRVTTTQAASKPKRRL